MPQDDPRTDRDTGKQQRVGARSEQMRGENTAAAEAMSTRMTEIGANSFNAGLRMQTEMFDTLQTIGRQRLEAGRDPCAEYPCGLHPRACLG